MHYRKLQKCCTNLRNYLLENQLQAIIDFGDIQVFEEATTYPCILNASKQRNINNNFISAAVKTLDYSNGFSAYLETTSNEITVETLNDETWVISSDSDQKLWLIGTFPVLNVNINNYPAIRDYLLIFDKKRLEQSGEKGSRKKTSGEWFETQDNIAYYQEFEKPKIMYQKFQVKPCFIYDEQGLYCNDSMWIISKADKVLLAILNSKMGWWLISKYCSAIQNGFQLIWKYFGQIPIPVINSEQSQPIILLVDKILTAKKSDPNADTTALEIEIDQLVYQLYELTAEEIKIIEG